MSKNDFDRRLKAIENVVKEQSKAGIRIDQTDCTVRVDRLHGVKGEPKTFSSVIESTQYVDKLLNSNENFTGTVYITNICDFYPYGDLLGKTVKAIKGDDISMLLNLAKFRGLEQKSITENVFLFSLRNHFNNFGFWDNVQNGTPSDKDSRLFEAFYTIYQFSLPENDEILLPQFVSLLKSVCKR